MITPTPRPDHLCLCQSGCGSNREHWGDNWYCQRVELLQSCEWEREDQRRSKQDKAASSASCTLSLRRGWRASHWGWQTLAHKLSPVSLFDFPWTSAWPSHQECAAAVCCKCLRCVNSGLCTGPGLMNWANSNWVAWDTGSWCITLLLGWQASSEKEAGKCILQRLTICPHTVIGLDCLATGFARADPAPCFSAKVQLQPTQLCDLMNVWETMCKRK